MSTAPTIDAEHLRAALAPIAPRHRLRGAGQSPLMEGQFFSHRLGEGMTLHGVEALELADTASTGDFPAGLSFTLLLEGQVAFCLGSRHYRVEAADKPVGLALHAAGAEPFTRYLRRGQWVRKLNVFVSRQWIEQRLGDTPRWLAKATQVTHWQPTASQIAMAQRLMAMNEAEARVSPLLMESRALEFVDSLLGRDLVGECLRPLDQRRVPLDRLVEPCVEGRVSLQTVAERLGMSVSTLQRRFKREFGVTVMEYLRGQRLELARHALLVDGCSVQQAAYRAGYEHASNFIQAFKRRFELTPADLVRRHRLPE